ncbi:MAG: hypothetical protein ACRDL5_11815, partial [Solirubrobacteraceae bacterium]
QTGYRNVDGFLWFSNPGGSGGQCVPGAPPPGQFWPARAVMLARNWVDHVMGPAYRPKAKQQHKHTHHSGGDHHHTRRH